MILGLLKRRRRRNLRTQPFPNAWRAIIGRNVHFFPRLSASDQGELLGHVQVLLAEKNFEGCAGLKLNDEIRVTIAAQAGLLLLHRDTDYFPLLVTILVYPSAYLVNESHPVTDHIWEEGESARAGHTGSHLDSMVLAWDEAKEGASDPSDGKNLVLHEFAHQLDFENHATDGTPVLATREQERVWSEVMRTEFAKLRAADETGIPALLDTYGASNPAEFFAVAVEAFFERPLGLRAEHPRLYAELKKFFRQDPVDFSAERAAAG